MNILQAVNIFHDSDPVSGEAGNTEQLLVVENTYC